MTQYFRGLLEGWKKGVKLAITSSSSFFFLTNYYHKILGLFCNLTSGPRAEPLSIIHYFCTHKFI
jgi:hypothetical protein